MPSACRVRPLNEPCAPAHPGPTHLCDIPLLWLSPLAEPPCAPQLPCSLLAVVHAALLGFPCAVHIMRRIRCVAWDRCLLVGVAGSGVRLRA